MNELAPTMVSVVIPSRNRPQLASRAVHSVLAQTVDYIEVIVVVDGPDEQTVQELKKIPDARLRIIELAINGGPAGARNAGVQAAHGNWVAFLDDDDEWLPRKIEQQLAVAHNSPYAHPVVASRFFARTATGELIWPRRLPRVSEPICEYLFVRHSLSLGEGFIQTSTLFAPRELLLHQPLNTQLPKHEDWDWLLHVCALEGVGMEFAAEPLAVWHSEIERPRLSNGSDWQYSLNWIRSVQKLVTPRAYAAFITTVVSSQAAAVGDWGAFWPLLWESIKIGRPRFFDILLYLSMWLVPPSCRQSWRARARR
jgi:glycosyltransferase involved in cell wall biosynthesis